MNVIVIEKDKGIPEEAITRLWQARPYVVLTGTGLSAESGVPTFHDAITGTWSNFKGMNYGKYTDNDC